MADATLSRIGYRKPTSVQAADIASASLGYAFGCLNLSSAAVAHIRGQVAARIIERALADLIRELGQ